ncbi:hypothetical protein C8J56DRAFT_954335, partial [Mycena floridula]
PGQIAAVTASIRSDEDSRLKTHVYICYNRRLPQIQLLAVKKHIEHLVDLARKTACIQSDCERAPSLSTCKGELTKVFVSKKLSTAIHSFGRACFSDRIRKYQTTLQQTMDAVVQDRQTSNPTFTATEAQNLSKAFEVLQGLPAALDKLGVDRCATLISHSYTSWRHQGHLPPSLRLGEKEEDVEELVKQGTVLVLFLKVQKFMADRGAHFPMTRWIRNISSFRFCVTALMKSWKSNRFNLFLEGSITFTFLPPIRVPEEIQNPPRCLDLEGTALVQAISGIIDTYGAKYPVHKQPLNSFHLRASIARFRQHIQDRMLKNRQIYATSLQVARYEKSEESMVQHIQKIPGISVYPYIGLSQLSRAPPEPSEVYKFADKNDPVVKAGILHYLYSPGWVCLWMILPDEPEKENLEKLVPEFQEQLALDISKFILNDESVASNEAWDIPVSPGEMQVILHSTGIC